MPGPGPQQPVGLGLASGTAAAAVIIIRVTNAALAECASAGGPVHESVTSHRDWHHHRVKAFKLPLSRSVPLRLWATENRSPGEFTRRP